MTLLSRSSILDIMNKLTREKQIQVLSALVEGNSIRSTVRMTGVAKKTVSKLLVDVGCACAEYHDFVMRNLKCKRVQCDEIWSFCYAKEKNVPADKKGQLGYGDVWTWTAIDADTKLIASWMVGGRDAEYAEYFIKDLAGRLANRVQLTTDGHKPYLKAIENAFANEIDYSMLVKIYGAENPGPGRYSPPKCTGCRKEKIIGKPDPAHVSTSYVERQNLSMRMGMRRFTRLTNGFSKKLENHQHALALYFMHYNFVRIHQSLRCSPAMEAGVSTYLWDLGNILDLLEK